MYIEIYNNWTVGMTYCTLRFTHWLSKQSKYLIRYTHGFVSVSFPRQEIDLFATERAKCLWSSPSTYRGLERYCHLNVILCVHIEQTLKLGVMYDVWYSAYTNKLERQTFVWQLCFLTCHVMHPFWQDLVFFILIL